MFFLSIKSTQRRTQAMRTLRWKLMSRCGVWRCEFQESLCLRVVFDPYPKEVRSPCSPWYHFETELSESTHYWKHTFTSKHGCRLKKWDPTPPKTNMKPKKYQLGKEENIYKPPILVGSSRQFSGVYSSTYQGPFLIVSSKCENSSCSSLASTVFFFK